MVEDILADARLETLGGLKYKLMEGYPTFKVFEGGVSAVEQYLMRSSDLAGFIEESHPLPYVDEGRVIIPGRRTMPGTTFLITKDLDVKPHTGQLPSDPLGVDSEAADGTYDPHILVTINYTTQKQSSDDGSNDRDELDPVTFLERSINVGGEFLSLGPQNTKTTDGGLGDDPGPEPEDSGQQWEQQAGVPDTGYSTVDTKSPSDTKATADPTVNFVKMIPTAELNYKWPFVVVPPWSRIFGYLGCVNGLVRDSSGRIHPEIRRLTNRLFYNLEPETVVFQGVSGTQKYLWNGASSGAQPWELDFKFSVKRVYEAGNVYGWNHIWVPKEQKWKKLVRELPGGSTTELYKQRNLLLLFFGGTAADLSASA